MRVKNFKKILTLILIVSLFSQTALVFSPKIASAQAGFSGGAGGGIQTGFDAQGIAGSALVCSGIADKMAGLLNGLFGSVIPTTVPINNPAQDLRDSCLKQITRTIINKILDKITLSTVNWINNGFEGQPLWLEDPEQFFGDIATTEINGVTGWFTCGGQTECATYPFGRLVMTQVLLALQSQTQQNLQFSLNQVLAHGTYEEFRYDFSVGGWAGYNAFLEAQNNPFGNYLLINQDLGRRIGGTNVVTARNFREDLSTSGGFLSPRVCAISGTGGDDYIPETEPLHLGSFYAVLPPGATLGDVTFAQLPADVQGELVIGAGGFQNAADQADAYNSLVLRSQCKKWRTTTPGNIVGTRLTQGLDTATNQLISADDVAENIGLIFDALLNQLIVAGLKGLDSVNNPDSVLLAQVNGQQPGGVANGQSQPPPVDVILGTGAADLPLVDVQTAYITNANLALPLLDQLIGKIRALDYCVPGPNPRWVNTATSNFQQALASVPPAPNGLPTDENQTYYRNIIFGLTGATIVESFSMYNHTQFQNFMQEVFNRYQARMLQNYSPTLAPPTTRLFLTALFTDMDVYISELADLNNYLANINAILPTVVAIQDALDAIAAANNGELDPNNPEVQAQVSIFNSISNHLATEDQLETLIEMLETYEARIPVIDNHIANCLNETGPGYAFPNSRKPYLFSVGQYYPPGLPVANNSFLPGVVFGDDDPSSDINIEINGVMVQFSSNDLLEFEAILQSVY